MSVEVFMPLLQRCKNAAKLLISTLLAAASVSIQALNLTASFTANDLSGRNAGKTCVAKALAAMAWWYFRSSVGSSVVHTTLTLNFFENALRRKFQSRQQIIGLFPNSCGALLVEQIVDAKIALQFQMGPVVQRFRKVCGTVAAQA